MRDLQTDRQQRRNCEQTRVGGMLQQRQWQVRGHRGMEEGVIRSVVLVECEILKLGTRKRRIFGVPAFAT